MKKLFLLLALLVAPLTVLSAHASAHSSGAHAGQEHITNFSVDATLTSDNILQVRETISYDFGSSFRHGIFRDIPIEYADGDNQYFLTAKVSSVQQDGNKVDTDESSTNGNLRLKIGDPDATITGQHTYTINYTLSPLIYLNNGKQFLNFDAIGTGWSVPIEHAGVSFKLANGSALSNVRCFTGRQGSTSECATAPTANNAVTAAVTDVTGGSGLTLNADVPDGFIASNSLLQANKRPPLSAGAIGFIIVIILAGLAAVAAMIVALLRWIRTRRLKAAQTIVPQYEPPASMTAGEIGLLEDNSAETAEITAAVVSLAVNGYLTITRLDKPSGIGGLFSKQDYSLSLIKPLDANVTEADTLLVQGFMGGQQTTTLNSIDRRSAANAVTLYKAMLKESLTSKGYYAAQAGLLQNGQLTETGAKQWATVKGFRLFLSTTETDRLKFTDAPERSPQQFSALLPYAIALGVEKQWAEQFKDLDISSATPWYNGGNAATFSAVAFTQALNDGFQSSLQSNSSVSSSGGSSGGGFGGGGGGSW